MQALREGETRECVKSGERNNEIYRNSFLVGSNSLHWWTRSQRIRTEGAILFEVALADPSPTPTYIAIAPKALHLEELKMNLNRIAVILNVERKTVVRALRWIRGKHVYPKKGP